MRSFAVVFLIGAVVLVALGLSQRSSLVYTLGVYPATVASELGPRDRVCQAPIRVPTGVEFDKVAVRLGTFGRPGPEMRVDVLDDDTDRRLTSGTLPAGYPDLDREGEHLVDVGEVRTEAPLRICLVNEGDRRVAAIGQVGLASPSTSATLNGDPLETDVTIDLHDGERSLLAWLPDIADRASVFRAGWVSPLTYLLLGIGVVVIAPVLLARGIARAAAADRER